MADGVRSVASVIRGRECEVFAVFPRPLGTCSTSRFSLRILPSCDHHINPPVNNVRSSTKQSLLPKGSMQ
jgi:hypothetical protein